MTTIGSLCTGIAGLDLAVEQHFDAELIWMSENDGKANEVLAVLTVRAVGWRASSGGP
jgi:site-specific DNA-cytosine methylase